MERILIMPPGVKGGWYMQAYVEYLIRYLSDEFFIDMGDVPYPPYKDFLNRYPETSPFMRNPDDYDLLVPLLATHWGVTEREKYKKKVACIWYEPNEGSRDVLGIASLTPLSDKSLENDTSVYWKSLKFGIDTDLFKPLNFKREDDLLHVGVVGTHINPRRMNKEVIVPLADIPGVRLMIFPNNWDNDGGNLEQVGGKKFLDHVVTGGKTGAGLANIYNQMDVYIRTDSDPGFACPILEAQACGVPVITTNQGIDKYFTEAGGGIMLAPDEPNTFNTTREWCLNDPNDVAKKAREAVIWMRDNPGARQMMGKTGRNFATMGWQWEDHIPYWREFFREVLKRAHSNEM